MYKTYKLVEALGSTQASWASADNENVNITAVKNTKKSAQCSFEVFGSQLRRVDASREAWDSSASQRGRKGNPHVRHSGVYMRYG